MAMAAESETKRWSSGQKYALWTALGIMLFFLLTEHRAHFLGILPWLLLAACPLVHLFMHHGHGGHGHDDHPSGGDGGGGR